VEKFEQVDVVKDDSDDDDVREERRNNFDFFTTVVSDSMRFIEFVLPFNSLKK
jgi:hypothetical protein